LSSRYRRRMVENLGEPLESSVFIRGYPCPSPSSLV
jgi:hypothetical protein